MPEIIIGRNPTHGGLLVLLLLLIFAAGFIYLDVRGGDGLAGAAAVIDGDTVETHGQPIKLGVMVSKTVVEQTEKAIARQWPKNLASRLQRFFGTRR